MEPLNTIEARILGCLIEKAITTPDYYPLTLHALTTACNQKSNRSPLMILEETSVVRGLEGLQEKGLAEKIFKADSRVAKYQHLFAEKLSLSKSQVAILCELMLRGPQTTGELRGRAGRMFTFEDLQQVEHIIQGLIEQEPPLITKLPRQPGRKEGRYMHLLSGEPDIFEQGAQAPEEPATLTVRAENERIEILEKELSALRGEFDAFKEAFIKLKSQFE